MRGRLVAATCSALLFLMGACAQTPPRVPNSATAGASVEDTLAQGDRARRYGRIDEALRHYAQAIELDARNVSAHLRYVALLSEQGRRSEALAVYRRRAAAPCAAHVERVMHARLETDGSLSQLQGTYQQAAFEDPGEVWWRLALAEIEIAMALDWQTRREEAHARSDREATEEARDAASEALGRADTALVQADALQGTLAEVMLYRGLVSAVRGDVAVGVQAQQDAYREAEKDLRQATTRRPDLVEAWEALGDVHARLGDHDRSLAALLMAADLQPADAHLRIAVGIQLQRTERNAEAARQYEQAIRLAPEDPTPWLHLGDAKAADERWEGALDAYTEALRRDPVSTEGLLGRGMALEHLGRRDEARTSYERYLVHGGDREATARRRIERLLRDPSDEARP